MSISTHHNTYAFFPFTYSTKDQNVKVIYMILVG